MGARFAVVAAMVSTVMAQTVPMGGAPGGLGGAHAQAGDVDLACVSGPRAAAWQKSKVLFRAIYEAEGISPLSLPPQEFLSSILDGIMKELKDAQALTSEAANECGLGKLCLQLLTFAAIKDPLALVDIFSGLEPLASPVLTMLLDIPWIATAQTGWPIFGLLATINMRKGAVQGALNTFEIDGLTDAPGQAFQAELAMALQSADGTMMQVAGNNYFVRSEIAQAKGTALAPLAALAAQAAGSPSPQERLQLLEILQNSFKQAIGSAAELDVAMSTNWPLWGMIQLALEPFQS